LTQTSGPDGYELTGLSCVDENGATVATPSNELTLAAGDDVTCTLTNDDIAPKLTLQKTVNGGSALNTAWELAATGPVSISGADSATSVTAAEVSAGTYTLSESGGPAGYTLTDV